ncbi:methyl-accepting chemotaxis protein [Methylobacillus gramineus]|uniref:methyl-accepting chemotaxis protein n=1 Tax=Methylobacillus gramineus TaxID=755169 RepID=UPI001D000CAA|nr:methyl-accepting chemotaxis protein [Methylobacillus gramineus]MCB5185058.1 methyl-accepting chemotaxis protein [Methylobacillus gramineus]
MEIGTSINGKLAIAFTALAGIVLVVSAMSLTSLQKANGRFNTYLSETNANAVLVAKLQDAVNSRAIGARNMLLLRSNEEVVAESERVKQFHLQVGSLLEQLQRSATHSNEITATATQMIGKMQRLEESYGPVALSIVQLALDGQREAAVEKLNNECQPLLAELTKATAEYSNYAQEQAVTRKAAGEVAFNFQRNSLIGICILAFLSAAGAGFWITRKLNLSLGSEPVLLGAIAQQVAGGDLRKVVVTQQIPAGSVMNSLTTMQQALAKLVGEVRDASSLISTGSAEISTANVHLSSRTEEQAASLEQTAASMEQLTVAVKGNADAAREAAELSASASDVAKKGANVVASVIDTMKVIDSSSQQISQILSSIEAIAFQTNILAINAAVEAARAGAEGKGFAVVANEVRTLAHNSAAAAKEIKSLIETSVANVATGDKLAQQAGVTMNEIVHSVDHVVSIINHISSSAAEQSRGIAQVNVVVSQLDGLTQENSAMVEETAAAAERLKEHAMHMNSLVGTFYLDEDGQEHRHR